MGESGAEHGLRTSSTKGLGRPSQGAAGRGDVINKQDAPLVGSGRRGKAAARKGETTGSRAPGLPTQTVSSQQRNARPLETIGNRPREQFGGRPRTLQPAQSVGGNKGDGIDGLRPGEDCHCGGQTGTERWREIVSATVLKGKDRGPKYAVVLPPDQGCLLRRGL